MAERWGGLRERSRNIQPLAIDGPHKRSCSPYFRTCDMHVPCVPPRSGQCSALFLNNGFSLLLASMLSIVVRQSSRSQGELKNVASF